MDYYSSLLKIPAELKEATVLQFPGTKEHGKIVFGFGSARILADELKNSRTKSVLVITDKTIVDLKLHSIVLDALSIAQCTYEIFDEVSPEPKMENAYAISSFVRKNSFDAVVGIGGGSVLDLGKIAALSATNFCDIRQYFGKKQFHNAGLPLYLIPTTSGTGSEISPFIVLQDQEKKIFTHSPFAYATQAIIDPIMSMSMPDKLTFSTGLDALAHGIEGVTAKQDPFTEAVSEKSIELIFEYLPVATDSQCNLSARYYLSFASILGMMAYIQGGGLYAHSISYILTSKLDTSHGVGCGIALPYTLKINAKKIENLYQKLSSASKKNSNFDGDIATNVLKLLGALEMPTTLKELGASYAMKDDFVNELLMIYPRSKNPVRMTSNLAKILFDAMWEGDLEMLGS